MLPFWNNVKDELEYNLMTQKELASEIQISYNTLQSWITKDRLPDAEQAVKIARKLNKNVEYLVDGKRIALSDELKPSIQKLIPKLKNLSEENLVLIGKLAEKLR